MQQLMPPLLLLHLHQVDECGPVHVTIGDGGNIEVGNNHKPVLYRQAPIAVVTSCQPASRHNAAALCGRHM